MTISISTFVTMATIALFGITYLAIRMHREAMNFVNELQFFLKQRTIAHNQVKARLAVLKTRFEKLEMENAELKTQVGEFHAAAEGTFPGILAETEFVEAQSSQLEKLELEISSIQEVLNGDFKAQLSNYLEEVDGLSQRLGKAKDEFSSQIVRNANKAYINKTAV